MVEFAAQIAAFATQVVPIAQLVLFGSSVVHQPILIGWQEILQKIAQVFMMLPILLIHGAELTG